MDIKKIKFDDFVNKVNDSSLKKPVHKFTISGYVGKSPSAGCIRVYADLSLSHYSEINAADVIHQEPLSAHGHAGTGSVLWIKGSANINHGNDSYHYDAKNNYFEGEIANAHGKPTTTVATYCCDGGKPTLTIVSMCCPGPPTSGMRSFCCPDGGKPTTGVPSMCCDGGKPTTGVPSMCCDGGKPTTGVPSMCCDGGGYPITQPTKCPQTGYTLCCDGGKPTLSMPSLCCPDGGTPCYTAPATSCCAGGKPTLTVASMCCPGPPTRTIPSMCCDGGKPTLTIASMCCPGPPTRTMPSMCCDGGAIPTTTIRTYVCSDDFNPPSAWCGTGGYNPYNGY